MSEFGLLLGPIAFQDFEVPSGIRFGGRQRLAVHRLMGGGRVIDALGQDDADISFCGTFSGSNATVRARMLDELRIAGQPLQLTWDVFFYTVFIGHFEADYQNRWWIPYQIGCTVLRDEADVLAAAVSSLATLALADLGTACTQAMAAGVDLSATTASLASPDATVRGTAAYSLGQANLNSAQLMLSTAVTTAGTNLDNAGLSAATSASSGIAGLSAASGAAQQLGMLTSAQGYAGRAAINLANASS